MPKIIIRDVTGVSHVLIGREGETVMQVARAADLQVVGECDGSMACATCHVVVDPDWADRLEAMSENEEAMLDTVFNLTPTSRLGCQIRLSAAQDGLSLSLPGRPDLYPT